MMTMIVIITDRTSSSENRRRLTHTFYRCMHSIVAPNNYLILFKVRCACCWRFQWIYKHDSRSFEQTVSWKVNFKILIILWNTSVSFPHNVHQSINNRLKKYFQGQEVIRNWPLVWKLLLKTLVMIHNTVASKKDGPWACHLHEFLSHCCTFKYYGLCADASKGFPSTWILSEGGKRLWWSIWSCLEEECSFGTRSMDKNCTEKS